MWPRTLGKIPWLETGHELAGKKFKVYNSYHFRTFEELARLLEESIYKIHKKILQTTKFL